MVVWCAGWLVAVSCTLWDTFFGHPASVYPGPPKILAHRAQAWGSRWRRPRRIALCAPLEALGRISCGNPRMRRGAEREIGEGDKEFDVCGIIDTGDEGEIDHG